MYSSANDGMDDELLPEGAQRSAPTDTAHLNYHDVAGLLPVLRLFGATGRMRPDRSSSSATTSCATS